MHTKITEYVKSHPTIKCGQFTRLHRCHDLVRRLKPVLAPAGSVVVWDNRLPHATAPHHVGRDSREAVFLTYLPAIPRNRNYADRQLNNYRIGQLPPDFRHSRSEVSHQREESCNPSESHEFTALGRKLMGIEEWDEDGALEGTDDMN
jgi:hypothetical protein